MNHRQLDRTSTVLTTLVIIAICFLLSGCLTTTVYVDKLVPADPIRLYHPPMPKPAPVPAVKVKVLTTDTIEDNQAYVGFKYNDWLLFAGWLKADQTLKKELKVNLDIYKKQDKSILIVDEDEIVE